MEALGKVEVREAGAREALEEGVRVDQGDVVREGMEEDAEVAAEGEEEEKEDEAVEEGEGEEEGEGGEGLGEEGMA